MARGEPARHAHDLAGEEYTGDRHGKSAGPKSFGGPGVARVQPVIRASRGKEDTSLVGPIR